MEPVQLGSTGLRVSPMCLGTMTFSATTNLTDARTIADMALDAGVFFWDTADMYSSGGSEQMVGRLLEGRRDQIVLATKVFAPMGKGANDRGLSARHILAAADASLARLGTDYIDLYYLHLPDSSAPIDESLRAMEDLVRSGRVRYVACSNYRAWEVVGLIETARRHNWQPVSAVQPLYNMANRDIEVEMLPMAAHHGLGVVSYSPLARGILTGKYRSDGPPPPDSRLARSDPRFLQAEWRNESIELADQLVTWARERGCTASQLATAWAMANQQITSVIIGPRTVEQAADGLGAAAVAIDDALEAAVDALVPPGTHTGKAFPDSLYPVTGRGRRS
jgi:aryl-alcohol dehydrogenase-like predicted oxidoreductase